MSQVRYIEDQPTKISFHERDLQPVMPKNPRQRAAMEECFQDQNLVMLGSAGTGKTFLAMYMALKEVLNKDTDFRQVVVVRSAVPVRDIGYLPGTEEEKNEIYELPYQAICDELFEYGKSYVNLKKIGKIKFVSTSYIRGITLKDSVIIVDECQSMNAHELDSIITRLGSGSKIIFCGDYIQTDLTKERDKRGMHDIMAILDRLHRFSRVDFLEDDIVRSGLVREYIIERNRSNFSC